MFNELFANIQILNGNLLLTACFDLYYPSISNIKAHQRPVGVATPALNYNLKAIFM